MLATFTFKYSELMVIPSMRIIDAALSNIEIEVKNEAPLKVELKKLIINVITLA